MSGAASYAPQAGELTLNVGILWPVNPTEKEYGLANGKWPFINCDSEAALAAAYAVRDAIASGSARVIPFPTASAPATKDTGFWLLDSLKRIARRVAEGTLKVIIGGASSTTATAVPILRSAGVTAMLTARAVVMRYLAAYWFAIEAGIATHLTLLLKDNTNPCALVYQGPISGGKSTVVRIDKYSRIAYASDKFTAASFVSHATNVAFDQLDEVDLLPRIKHRCLLTEELSTIFRKSEEELQTSLSTITRVLDGEGFTSDSGSHGRRGYTGDYQFTWLGGSTPLPRRAWVVMAQLGSRMLFFNLTGQTRSKDQKVLELSSTTSFSQRRDICAAYVSDVIDAFIPDDNAIRSIAWPRNDPPEVLRAIVDLAELLAVCRRVPEHEGHMGQKSTFMPQEDSSRATSLLFNLACGRAIAYGRRTLLRDDLDLLFHITLSSMPEDRGQILQALAAGHTTLTSIASHTGLSYPTVKSKSDQLIQLDVLEEVPPPVVSTHPGRPAVRLRFCDPYLWLRDFSKNVKV